MNNPTAWYCPSCNKHHAPHVETCPAPVDCVSPLRYEPGAPIFFGPTYDPCANCKGVCGNVACPRLSTINVQCSSAGFGQ